MSATTEKPVGIEPSVLESSNCDTSDPGSSGPSIDRSLEKRLLWKLDIRVVPVLWCLFLVAFMDRSNIGCDRKILQPGK